MLFNERLRALRKDKGMKQEDAAKALGLNYRHYQRLEAGENAPKFENLLLIADFYKVSLDYLAGRTDNREVNP